MATPEELNKSGMAFYKAGKYSEAAAAYEEAITAKPDYAPCHVNLTIAYLKLNRPDDAVRAAQRAAALAPQAGPVQYYLGNAMNAKGRWNEAVSAYVRASELDNGQIGASVIAAHLLMDHGLRPKAAALLRKFLTVAPPDHPKRQESEQLLRETESSSGLISKF